MYILYYIGLHNCVELKSGNNATSAASILIVIVTRVKRSELDYYHNSTQISGVNLLSPVQLITKVELNSQRLIPLALVRFKDNVG